MAWAKCHEAGCGWEVHDLPTGTALTAWRNHHDRTHSGDETVHQLPTVTFHEQALQALLALAKSGRKFTVGEAHPMVAIPPTNPRTDWEVARKDAERLGWLEWTGEYTESIVPSTKGSAVKVWQGTYAVRRAVA